MTAREGRGARAGDEGFGPLSDDQLAQFRDLGYLVIPGLIGAELVARIHAEITRIVDRHPDCAPDLVQIEPRVISGEFQPVNKELGVRKLFRMVRDDEFFADLAAHPRLLSMAIQMLGPDVKLLQSMMLMKPPGCGGVKVWHQDNAYFRLTRSEPADYQHQCDVFGFWIACDDATVDNGCMHVIPGSHQNGIAVHAGEGDLYGLREQPRFEDTLALPMKSGDGLLFHGEIWHGTPANQGAGRRRAMQYHYAASACRGAADRPRGEALVAGREFAGCI